jgi:magnesium chelatase subunit D
MHQAGDDDAAQPWSDDRLWADAALAAALLAVDPPGCGGVLLRAPAGPVRDAWLALLARLLGPDAAPLRMPLGIGDDRLLGGLDLTATLRAGRPVADAGLLVRAHGRVLLAAMAERMSPGTAARVASVMDHGEVRVQRDGMAANWPARFGIVALDEGEHDDERAPPSLAERLAMWLDLGELPPRTVTDDFGLQAEEVAAARRRLAHMQTAPELLDALVAAAHQLGIDSMRAPVQALAVARSHAALAGRDAVEPEDVEAAARLVLAPRATVLPAPQPEEADADAEPPAEPSAEQLEEPPEEPTEPPPEAEDTPPEDEAPMLPEGALDEQILEAALAALPAGLLAKLKATAAGRARASGDGGKAGDWQRGTARGRPAGVKRGEPRAGQRLDLIETLRAAAPWQRLRQSAAAASASGSAAGPQMGPLVRVRPEDFHVRRYRQRRSTTTVFVVDASGSSALNRLGEAKGAVELLLADCYVRRDRVAVLGFRGRAAELLLPPTRSLVRAKRSLAGLPGGGGTPLAAALDAANELARAIQRRGETPVLVFLTDGRANVARDGTGGRARAEQDALAAARALAAEGVATLLVDTSAQPQPAAEAIAAALMATYLPLPYAGAAALSGVVAAHAGGRAQPGGRHPTGR